MKRCTLRCQNCAVLCFGSVLFFSSILGISTVIIITRTLANVDILMTTIDENPKQYDNYCEWAKVIRKTSPNYWNLSTIYVITPSKKRLTQKADLTRLSHTLQLVPKLHWILVDDSDRKSKVVQDLLQRTCLLNYTHLAITTNNSLTKGKNRSSELGIPSSESKFPTFRLGKFRAWDPKL